MAVGVASSPSPSASHLPVSVSTTAVPEGGDEMRPSAKGLGTVVCVEAWLALRAFLETSDFREPSTDDSAFMLVPNNQGTRK